MPDSVKQPAFSNTISLGNIMQMLAFVLALAGAWGGLAVAWGSLTARNEAVQTSLTDEVGRGIERDARIRSLEVKAERADERYNSIMALLHRIDKSIERMGKRD